MDISTFHASIDSTGDGCWEWQRARIPEGYGAVSFNGKQRGAHRLAWCLANDRDIDSLARTDIIMHSCDNPPCCNPAHLSLGTFLENRRQQIDRGRNGDTRPKNPKRGSMNGNSKLTEDDVRLMRFMYGRGQSIPQCAVAFGISTSTARACLNGTTWAHVPGAVEMRSRRDGRWL